MNKTQLQHLTIASTNQMLKKREISPTELISLFFKHIEKWEPHVKAWVTFQQETAMEQAKALEMKMKTIEELPPLFAIPYGAKDIIYTKGIRTEAGSNVLKGFVPETDATVVHRLQKADAVLLGKTTTTEFANWGGAPETRNPWNVNHTPGGSSSGSAAALAANMALMTLGTQTAGSLSRPAAYNGLTVLKATYGRISKAGVIPASWSLDHVGALTKTVEDAVHVYNVLSGPDPDDTATWTLPKQALKVQTNKDYTVGIVVDSYFQDADSEMAAAIENAVYLLQSLGIKTVPVRLPKSLEAGNAAHHIVMKCETASYHADQYAKDPSRFHAYLQQFIREGLQIKAIDYLKAQRIRSVFRQELCDVFKDVDLLVTPATPSPAPEGIKETGSPAYNLPFTNAGVPTLTLPVGFLKDKNLPLGMQLIAAPMQEQKLIDVGHLFQLESDWHKQSPELVNKVI